MSEKAIRTRVRNPTEEEIKTIEVRFNEISESLTDLIRYSEIIPVADLRSLQTVCDKLDKIEEKLQKKFQKVEETLKQQKVKDELKNISLSELEEFKKWKESQVLAKNAEAFGKPEELDKLGELLKEEKE